jgi:CheY-like chemotaxis protein
MIRLLLVAAEAERSGPLTQELAREGFTVRAAPEGFYALTMMERELPALVLLDGAGGDLPAAELAAIVRADPALAGVTLVLAPRPGDPAPEGFDLLLGEGLSPAELAATLRRRALDGERPDALVLSGSIDDQDLPQLAGTLGHARRTGRLCLVFPGDRLGEIYLDQGQVVHTRFGAEQGRTAFAALLAAARGEVEIVFDFEALTREEVFRYPRTLVGDVQGLLLHTLADLDETARAGDRSREGLG